MRLKVSPRMKKTEFLCSWKCQSNPEGMILPCISVHCQKHHLAVAASLGDSIPLFHIPQHLQAPEALLTVLSPLPEDFGR